MMNVIQSLGMSTGELPIDIDFGSPIMVSAFDHDGNAVVSGPKELPLWAIFPDDGDIVDFRTIDIRWSKGVVATWTCDQSKVGWEIVSPDGTWLRGRDVYGNNLKGRPV